MGLAPEASDQFTHTCGPTCSMCSRPLCAHTGWVAVKFACRPCSARAGARWSGTKEGVSGGITPLSRTSCCPGIPNK